MVRVPHIRQRREGGESKRVAGVKEEREKESSGSKGRKREKINGQLDTEIYPQGENEIRGKRSLIEERGEVREIKGRRLGLGFCRGTKPEERKSRN